MTKIFEKKYNSGICEKDRIKKILEEIIDNSFVWKKINSKEDIINIINSEKAIELLSIQDWYDDLIDEIYKEEYNREIDYNNDRDLEEIYINILNNENPSQKLKDCIEIVLKAMYVCKRLYENVIKKQI